MYDENYYKNKKVLVTGADGFMGSHLVDRLVDMHADVIAYVKSHVIGPNKFELRNIAHQQNNIRVIGGDLSASDAKNMIVSCDPDIIFHLAAEAYVPKSFNQPLEVIRANSDGTLNVLEAVRALPNLARAVITSSSEIYGSHDEPIKEDDVLRPTSPYGASKLAADRYAWAWYNTYHLPIAIIRPFNTYGPRHTYDVIPIFIRRALKDQPLMVHGGGTQTRDLSYVDDTINAFLIMGSDDKAVGKVVNFGTGIDTKILDLAYKVKEISGSASPIQIDADRPAEVQRLCADISLAKSLFGWETKVSLKEGLKRNIEWARNEKS